MHSVQNPEWIVGGEAQAELDRAGVTSNKLLAALAESPLYGIETLPGQRNIRLVDRGSESLGVVDLRPRGEIRETGA